MVMTLLTYLSVGALGFSGGIIAVGFLLRLSSAPHPVDPSALVLFGRALVQMGFVVGTTATVMLLVRLDPFTRWRRQVSPPDGRLEGPLL